MRPRKRSGASPIPRIPFTYRDYGEPTSGLEPLTCSLRVIHRALHGYAESRKSCISRRLSLLWVAACCTVLRSRWCQGGVSTPLSTDNFEAAPTMEGEVARIGENALPVRERLPFVSLVRSLRLPDGKFLLRRVDTLAESSGSPSRIWYTERSPSGTILRQALLGWRRLWRVGRPPR